MTITSRYKSRCTKCGTQIQPGEQIEWSRNGGSAHIACPDQLEQAGPDEITVVLTAATERANTEQASGVIRIGQGSGYGGRPYTVGSVIRNRDHAIKAGGPEYLVVLSASQRFIREDGMSFGVGEDDGYYYSATCRAAAEEETRPLIEEIAQVQDQRQALADLKQVAEQIEQNGEHPEGSNLPEGEQIEIPGTGDRLYGSGSWFVLGVEYVWYVRNNGMDGDNWSYNNVRTGGAGAIGWRVSATQELADTVRQLATTINARG